MPPQSPFWPIRFELSDPCPENQTDCAQLIHWRLLTIICRGDRLTFTLKFEKHAITVLRYMFGAVYILRYLRKDTCNVYMITFKLFKLQIRNENQDNMSMKSIPT